MVGTPSFWGEAHFRGANFAVSFSTFYPAKELVSLPPGPDSGQILEAFSLQTAQLLVGRLIIRWAPDPVLNGVKEAL